MYPHGRIWWIWHINMTILHYCVNNTDAKETLSTEAFRVIRSTVNGINNYYLGLYLNSYLWLLYEMVILTE